MIMGVSQSTISRVLTTITPLVRAATEEFVPTVEEAIEAVDDAVVILDGSEAPCWSWADHGELWSGKSGTTGHNFAITSSLAGDTIHISEALPASAHDMSVLRETDTATILEYAGGVIADLDYEGSGYTIPAKKPKNGSLLLREKEFNTDLSGLRSGVERAVSHIKTWKVLHTDYRRPIATWEDSFEAIIGLYFFSLKTDF